MLTDRLEDTVDYAEVCDIVALAATERSYRTLERLCQVIGERLMERFGCESVRVRAAKPEPPLPLAIQEVARRGRPRARRHRGRARTTRPSELPGSATSASAPTSAIARPTCGRRSQPLREHGVEVEAVSSTYETEPVGEVLDQPDFLNAAVRIRTELEPEELLDVCKAIEVEQGRCSGGPRTARARSTSTCSCSATSSSRPSG